MKRLLFILFLIPVIVRAQCDTATSKTLTILNPTSVQVSWTQTGTPVALNVRYVRVGHSDTAETKGNLSTTVTINSLLNGQSYWYAVWVYCSGASKHTVYKQFTMAAPSVGYTPFNGAYDYKYLSVDTALSVPFSDTLLNRAQTRPGEIVCNTRDSSLWMFNGLKWARVGIDSSGIVNKLNSKVDSVTNNGSELFYWINGTSYGALDLTGFAWRLTGNSGTTAGTNYIGTNDGAGLMFKVNGTQAGYIDLGQNTSLGISSLVNNIGSSNVAIGVASLFSNTTGYNNTAIGSSTLAHNTTGYENTAIGVDAIGANVSITGHHNTGLGANSLFLFSGSGNDNTGVGASALGGLISGSLNTAVGEGADVPSTTGSNQLSICNLIYGAGMDGIGTSISTGNIGIGVKVPAASAKLDIVSTTQGFLPPRMTATQASAIASPAEGLLVYVTNTNGTFTSKGWWGYDGAAWQKLNN